MTYWKPNVADSSFLFTSLTLNFHSLHTGTLHYYYACVKSIASSCTQTHTHTPPTHWWKCAFPCAPPPTLSLTSHTQTKQCYLAAVPLLMCRECWSQFFSHTQWTYVSQKQGRLCIPSFKKKKKVCFLFSRSTSKVSSDSCRKTLSDSRRWPCCVCVRACVCSNV